MIRALILLPVLVACNPDEEGTESPEVITTLTLTFTPTGGGDALVFVATDPDNTGMLTVDDIELSDADDYTLTVEFFNDLEDEDITEEVEEEDDEHQVFITGSAVDGPATANVDAILTHAYADMDGGGLPVGLTNDIVTNAEGMGELRVVLQHLPPQGDVVVKLDGLAEAVAAGGFGNIAGEPDIDVTFDVSVVP